MENKLINEVYRINELMGIDNIIVENFGVPLVNSLRKLFTNLSDDVIEKLVKKTGNPATDKSVDNIVERLKSNKTITVKSQNSLNNLLSQIDAVKFAKIFSKSKQLLGEDFYNDIIKYKKLLKSNPDKYDDVITTIDGVIDNVPYLKDLPGNLKNSLKLELRATMDKARGIGEKATVEKAAKEAAEKEAAEKAAKEAAEKEAAEKAANVPPPTPGDNNIPNIQKTWDEVTSSITDDTIKKIEKKYGRSWGAMLSRLGNAITIPFKKSIRLQNEIIQDFAAWGKASPNSRPIIKNNIIAKLQSLENSQQTILDATNNWIEKELGPKAAINPVTKLPIDSDFHVLYNQIKEKKGWGKIKFLDKIYNSIGIAIKDIIDNNKLMNGAFFKAATKPITIPVNFVTKMFTGKWGNLGKLTDEQVKALKNWFMTTNPAGFKGIQAAFKNNGTIGGLSYVGFQALYRYFWTSTVYGIIRTLGALSAAGYDLSFDKNISDTKIINYLFGTKDWKEMNQKFVENPDLSKYEYAMALKDMIGKQSEPFKKWLGMWPLGKVLEVIWDTTQLIQNNKLKDKANEVKQEVEKSAREVKRVTDVRMDEITDKAESLKGKITDRAESFKEKVTKNNTTQPQNTTQSPKKDTTKGGYIVDDIRDNMLKNKNIKNNLDVIVHNKLRSYLNEQSSKLPSWVKGYPCLSDRGTMKHTTSDDQVVFLLDSSNQYFFKDMYFSAYDKKTNNLIREGSWECVNGKLIITSDDGKQWTKDGGWVVSPQTELPQTELPQTELPQTELPQTELITDKWEEVSGDYLEKLKAAGKKLMLLGNKWYHNISDKISGPNTLKSTLPSWTRGYDCLSDVGRINKTGDDNKVVYYGDNHYFYFFKDKAFTYEKKDEPKINGTWECVNGKLIIKTEDGQQWTEEDGWVDQPTGSINTSTSDDTKIYKTYGDPYQYKVVDGEWFTKSLENRGKIIPDWISLADNIKATNILDGRFPEDRKK